MLHREVEECDMECELDCAPHNEKTEKCLGNFKLKLQQWTAKLFLFKKYLLMIAIMVKQFEYVISLLFKFL